MATIKDGTGSAQLGIDATSKAARVTLYDPNGNALTSAGVRGTALNLRTDGGTDSRDGLAILVPGTTGGVPAGTATTPLRTDPTGTTAQPVTGTLAISAIPNVAGAVSVTNFPTQFNVGNFPTTQQVAGSVNVANFPGTQTVAGSVSVANFPGTQAVSGSVAVANFPGVQPISGTVAVAGTVIVDPLPEDIGLSYTAVIDVVPTTVTASTVYWSLRNSGTKSVYLTRFDFQQGFTGTAAASRSSFELIRYTGTPAGGTALASVKKDSTTAASAVAILMAPAGLTVTGVTFDGSAFHRQTSANQLAAISTQDVTFADHPASQLKLAPGEGVAIRANGAVVAGAFLTGSVGWREQ